jgi:hypothetical protein
MEPRTARVPRRRLESGLRWCALALLLFLHHDSWRERTDALRFGFLPDELVWRLCWIVAAVAWLFWLTTPRADDAAAR